MKKGLLFITAMIAMALVFGCAGMGIQPDPNQDVFAKIAGHRAGFELGKANLVAAIEFQTAGEEMIKMIETGEAADANTYIHKAIEKLTVEIAKNSDDPALIAEIMILSDMLVFSGDVTLPIDPVEMQKYLAQMKGFMEGFKMGVSLATLYQ